MEFYKAFFIAVIDEDYEGKNKAGRGMRNLAQAIEREGFRVIGGITYADARRLVNVFTAESCWLISVDGIEDSATRWDVLAEVLAAKRSRSNRLPIFLFGDETTAEIVPVNVLHYANTYMRLFEGSAEFMARAIVTDARNYLERLQGYCSSRADEGCHA
ncbi:hypothetical protein ABIA27_001382 [Sinorhizobium fredii]